MSTPGAALPLTAFDPTAILVLNLAGTFVFGLSGALAGARARLDAFGVLVLREVPHVLRSGLYAVPALVGSTIAVAAARGGQHDILFAMLGALTCFLIRLAALRWNLSLPELPHQAR